MGKYEHSDISGARDWETQPASSSACQFPADFSPDEAQFAAELRGLFRPDFEELPPLYVQTLVGEPVHAPVEKHYERKVTHRVFHRLGVARPPVSIVGTPARAHWWAWFPDLSAAVRRLGPVGAALATCAALFMVLGLVMATPSFAAGMRILLGHSGVTQVPGYPTTTRPSALARPAAAGDSAQPLTWIEWPGSSIHGYTYQDMIVTPQQEWTDGPLVDLRYMRQGSSAGSGVLDIREFRPANSLAGVLQVVADGSATQVIVGSKPGVFVDGRWVHRGSRPMWQPGIAGELIFEEDGLIFWIVADQRDGMTPAQLAATALQLAPVSLHALLPQRPSLRAIGLDVQGEVESPIGDEVLALVPAGSSLEDGAAAFVSYAPGKPDMQ
ncbi:MAG TPA: hypothetical protein VGN32_16635 [Ktedonobacterales bacterium]|nr:hypothetical protein [Ktedonobacterales bacterium]